MSKQQNNTRKDNGDGCVYQISENKWVARIKWGKKSNGKPNEKSFSGKSEQIVKRKLREFKKNRDKFTVNVSSCTLTDYITNWLKLFQSNKLKPTSYDRLESTLNNHIIPNMGFLQLSSINQDDIQALINKLYKDDYSYSSIKKVYDALNACFKHALIKDDIIKNPVLGTSLPAKANFKKKEIIVFNEDEINKIKKEIERTYSNGKRIYVYGDAYILILNTGMRLGEALGLKWEDVNFEKKTLHIQRNIITVKNREEDGVTVSKGYTVKEQDSTKTYSGDRIINLNNNAIKALNNLKKENTEYVITNSKGNFVPPHNFSRSFYCVLDNTKLKMCGVHTLRHTFASLLFKKGVDVKTVSDILGHSSVKITYDTYIHLINEQKVQAVELLDDI